MRKLTDPGATMEVVRRHGLVLQKKYGQNFLLDPRVMEKIIRGSDIGKDDFVLEIGPGIGSMTQWLAEAAGRVAAVEIDGKLLPVLAETLAGFDNVTVVHQDILKMDLPAFLAEHAAGMRIKAAANLPYYITTPIVMKLLEEQIPFVSMTFMVQKEVAERMAAGPGTKSYGALSLAVQYYCEAEVIANVPENCFFPRPKVGSAVVRLLRREKPAVDCGDPEAMRRIIRGAFGQRRKTLANALSGAGEAYEKPQIYAALRAMGLPETIRGEALTLAEFAELTDRLCFNA